MNLFNYLPEKFFIPLASKNKRHYSNLLLAYYSLFRNLHTGVERETVVSKFEEYFKDLGDFTPEEDGEDSYTDSLTPRNLASFFLRKLIHYGWMSEEVKKDFTQYINLTSWAKPFYAALQETIKGQSVEYESFIIRIHSSLCSEAVEENGHLSVMNAYNDTLQLIESLKVLAQNIKNFVEEMFSQDAEVKEILHFHYDIYIHEIVDKAYNRLKTSDNLSRYRPRVTKAINAFLKNREWMNKSSVKLGIIKNKTREEAEKDLVTMLNEIKNELKDIDPILKDIDDKNRQYSRLSMEKIKSRLYADATLQGKVQAIIRGFLEEEELISVLDHKLSRAGFVNRESLYTRRRNKDFDIKLSRPEENSFEMEKAETEMILRIKKQLNPEKIIAFLDQVCRKDGTPTPAEDIIVDMNSFVRILYAVVYSESRDFPYRIKWREHVMEKGRFRFKEFYILSSGGASNES